MSEFLVQLSRGAGLKFKEFLCNPIKLKPEIKALLCLAGVGVIAGGSWIISQEYIWTGFFVCLVGIGLFVVPAMDNDNYQGGG